MSKISPDVPYAVLDSILDNDSSYMLISEIQERNDQLQKRVLKFELRNFPRNVLQESRWDYVKRSLKHYTSRSNIVNAHEYLKLYFKKSK